MMMMMMMMIISDLRHVIKLLRMTATMKSFIMKPTENMGVVQREIRLR